MSAAAMAANPLVLTGGRRRARMSYPRHLLRGGGAGSRLPGDFGRNWDALTDSLRDVTRAGNVTLIVEHAEVLLGAEPPNSSPPCSPSLPTPPAPG